MPQVLPEEHDEDGALAENESPPLGRAAKADICLVTCWLPQTGQATSAPAALLRTSFSNGCLQSSHLNS